MNRNREKVVYRRLVVKLTWINMFVRERVLITIIVWL